MSKNPYDDAVQAPPVADVREQRVCKKFNQLKETFKQKNLEYGDQLTLINKIFDVLEEHFGKSPQVNAMPPGYYHYSMEIMAKALRFFKLFFYESEPAKSIDSLHDIAVYAVMLSAELENNGFTNTKPNVSCLER